MSIYNKESTQLSTAETEEGSDGFLEDGTVTVTSVPDAAGIEKLRRVRKVFLDYADYRYGSASEVYGPDAEGSAEFSIKVIEGCFAGEWLERLIGVLDDIEHMEFSCEDGENVDIKVKVGRVWKRVEQQEKSAPARASESRPQLDT